MASEEHLAILREGVEAWNAWRHEHSGSKVDLIMADLRGADLRGANLIRAAFIKANLSKADLSKADLQEASFQGADLRGANLRGANLIRAAFSGADLCGADLRGANLREAKFNNASLHKTNLSGAVLFDADFYMADLSKADLSRAALFMANIYMADLRGADLRGADLEKALLVGTRLESANLTGCRIHGMSAWDLNLEGATQKDLIITRTGQPEITVDNLEVAQFIYLLLNNEKIRDVIDTITSKVVLILGRFTPERRAVLDALREELRQRNYLPVLFDFDKSASRDITETVSLLARMARFVVADVTDARSIPQELGVIVPDLPSVPVQPLLLAGTDEYGMFEHFQRYPWVLETYVYASADELIANLGERVIGPAEAKAGR
jgi:uncharacterized protein YjbI with pentapeptide repeats